MCVCVFFNFISSKLSIFRRLSIQERLRYSCQRTIELIRWIMWSPPWFCLRLSFSVPWIHSGQKPRALWKPAMWHLAASAPSEGQRGPRCTFHGNAEKQRLLRGPSGWCQGVRLCAPPTGASGDVCAHVSPEVKTAEHQVSHEQKDFPLDERVQTLRAETRQDHRRSVRHNRTNEAFFFFPFKRLLTSSYTVNEGELAHILSFSGSKGQEVFNEAGRINTTWLSLTLLGFNLNDINNFHNASNSN